MPTRLPAASRTTNEERANSALNPTALHAAGYRGKIEGICRAAGYDPPMLCTPMELMEE